MPLLHREQLVSLADSTWQPGLSEQNKDHLAASHLLRLCLLRHELLIRLRLLLLDAALRSKQESGGGKVWWTATAC